MTYPAKKIPSRTFSQWQSLKKTSSSATTGCEGISPLDKDQVTAAMTFLGAMLPDLGLCDGQMPSKDTLNLTQEIINYLPLAYLHANVIRPDGEGGLTMIWNTEDEGKTILTIDGVNYHLSSGPLHGEASYRHDRPFFDENFNPIPKEITDVLPKRTVRTQ